MLDLLVTLVTGQIGANLKRYARLAAFAVLAGALALIALAAGAAALFMALASALGPIEAALILAALAAALAGIVSIPLWRKPAERPPSAAATLVQLALAVGLGFLADRKARREAP